MDGVDARGDYDRDRRRRNSRRDSRSRGRNGRSRSRSREEVRLRRGRYYSDYHHRDSYHRNPPHERRSSRDPSPGYLRHQRSRYSYSTSSSFSERDSRSRSAPRSKLDDRERGPRGSSGHGFSSDRRPRGSTDLEHPDNGQRDAMSQKSSSSVETESSSEEFEEPGDVHLDDKVLALLGGDLQKDNDSGGKIHHVLIKNWTEVLKKGISKEILEEIMKKYPTPDSFLALKPPVINAEVKTTMSDGARKKDEHQSKAQTKIGAAIFATGLALTTILNQGKEKDPALVTFLSDAARLLSDVHYSISISRRAFITPNVNKLVGDVTTDQPIEALLFGEKLSERLKAAQEVEKQSKTILKPSTSSKQSSTNKGGSNRPYQKSNQPSQYARNSGYNHQPKQSLNFKGPSGAARKSFRGRQDGQKYRNQGTRGRY